jgi:biopolymer transport protein ExbB
MTSPSLGLAHFWAQGDSVSHLVALALLLMSVGSWTLMLHKLLAHWRVRHTLRTGLDAFWAAPSRAVAVDTLRREDRSLIFATLATDAELAAQAYEQKSCGGIGAGVDASEFIGRTLQQSIVHAQARVESGLTFLASVGSTAPFVGLFGTVWGIYHALIGLSGAARMSIDQVAGPVGEALVMTAAGLFVAIPAVLAYNACTRANRLVLAQLDGFAHSLHAFLVAGVRVASPARAAD